MMSQSQFHNKLVDLNDTPIVENIPDLNAYRSSNPIHSNDINVPKMEQVGLDISDTRGKRKGKMTKCWDLFKLVSIGCTTDGNR